MALDVNVWEICGIIDQVCRLEVLRMSKFEYPIMSRGEIVAILAESQIGNISEHDLFNPNPDFISELYTRLLFHIDALHE